MRSFLIPSLGLVSAALFFVAVVFVNNAQPFKSIELGLAELSPSGELGGFAIPASGASQPASMSYSCGSTGTSVTIWWSASYDLKGHSHPIVYNFRVGGVAIDGMSATSWSGAISPDTSYYAYVYGCSDGSCSSATGVSFRCVSPPPVATLEARNVSLNGSWSGSNLSILVGQQAAVRWNSSYTTSCSGSNFSTNNAVSGTQDNIVEPILGETKQYTLACVGRNGSTVYDTLQMIGTGVPPAISSDPKTIRSGDSATISWNVNDAEPARCYVNGPGLNKTLDASTAVGSVAVTVTNESTYTIDCGISGKASVTVHALPVIQET